MSLEGDVVPPQNSTDHLIDTRRFGIRAGAVFLLAGIAVLLVPWQKIEASGTPAAIRFQTLLQLLALHETALALALIGTWSILFALVARMPRVQTNPPRVTESKRRKILLRLLLFGLVPLFHWASLAGLIWSAHVWRQLLLHPIPYEKDPWGDATTFAMGCYYLSKSLAIVTGLAQAVVMIGAWLERRKGG
ncbi:MAG TPA: hypothetical protein VKT78_19100 [Fimbriimonadaceae bacterium]|nr:hypothetical protein [Fimbriimonadaceae bacterium]